LMEILAVIVRHIGEPVLIFLACVERHKQVR
jgi:hypothetical protein